MALRIRLLGGLEIERDEPASGPPAAPMARKAGCLLAVLARHPGRPHARATLAAMLWPESAPARARASLRQALRQVRAALGAADAGSVRAEAETLALDPAGTGVDVARFEEASEQADPAALEAAARLYRGDFLAGVPAPTDPFAEWVHYERLGLRERAMAVLDRLVAQPAGARDPEVAVEAATRLLALDPLQERVHRALMRLHLEQGRRGAALEQYRACRAALGRTLGVAPDAETEAVHAAIRAGGIVPGRAGGSASAVDREERSRAFLERPAVAVLPFANLDRDPDRDYFADGLSEDVIAALAGWRQFPLIASASTFTCREPSPDLRGTAQALGARYVVLGSVRSGGERFRITARLVDADSGLVLWVERFDVGRGDVLAAQAETAERIAAVVEPELESAERARIVPKRTEDLDAWDWFMMGLPFLGRHTPESNARARECFGRALALDPGYADAHTGIAQAHLQDIRHLGSATAAGSPGAARAESLAHGVEAARRAVDLDPRSSAAHLALGHAHVWAEDLDTAMAETELAVDLNPSNAQARMALGNRLDLAGHNAQGIAEMERGLRLNPRDPRRWGYMGFLARAHLDARNYEVACAWASRAVRVRPDQPDSHFRLAACLAHLGRHAEARAAAAESERLRPGYLASRAGWRPYSDPGRSRHFLAGLRAAGVL